MSEHMSPATRTPPSGRNTAPCPGACPSCTIGRASGPSHGMTRPSSARIRPTRSRSCPGTDCRRDSRMLSRSVSARLTAAGAAYLGASPSPALHSTWSQCG